MRTKNTEGQEMLTLTEGDMDWVTADARTLSEGGDKVCKGSVGYG